MRNLYTCTKAPNEVFTRNFLATAKQQPGKTLDELYLKLQKLARDCNFRQVTSEQYRQETVRDALTNGLSSNGMRQRLLENRDLNLGYCNVDITVNGSNYSDVKLRVLKNLFTDILLGKNFQSLHKQVIFQY